MSDAPDRRSILDDLAKSTGISPKVFLPDDDSEHGSSPVVDPGAPAAKLVPRGRGNYQLLGQIARGGMSVILKGHDTDLGRDVAVKVLDEELAKRPEVVQRFVEEAQIGGQLQHPGIVPVYELGLMADERPYFTMKLVKGRTLASLFQQRKAPTDDRGRLLGIFEAVCQTVAYAHSKGVIHRDLKPANIMVGAFGEVQVVDWGLAKVLGRGGVDDERRAQDSRASLASIIETIRSGPGSSGSDSLAGSIMGTPAYMAPEQAQGEIEKLDERADVFALGAILCELLTGAPPYDESAPDAVVVQAARAQLDPARARVEASGADPALVRLCLDCLTPARAARPATAGDVGQAIHEYVTSTEERARRAEVEAVEARLKEASARRAHRLTAALAAAIVLAVVAGGGSYLWVQAARSRQVEQTRTALEAAHGEALAHLQAGDPEAALVEARRALSLAEAGTAEEALLERSRSFVARAEAGVAAAGDEAAARARDAALLGRLEEFLLERVGLIGDFSAQRELDVRIAATFLEYGADLEAADLVPALELFRERGIEVPVALALDCWLDLRRMFHAPDAPEVENLFLLAMDLDPDPVRSEVRVAIRERDAARLVALATSDEVEQMQADTIYALAVGLWSLGSEYRDETRRLVDRAAPLYPGDYVLQSLGGTLSEQRGRYTASLARRAAVLGQRPDDLRARAKMMNALLFLGHLVDCEQLARSCIALDPEEYEGHYMLAMALLQLGRHAEALEALERAYALRPDEVTRVDVLTTRFLVGEVGLDEVLEEFESTVDRVSLATIGFTLVEHPDPERRAPVAVLERLDELEASLRDQPWPWLLRALASMVLEDWEGAAEALAGQYGHTDIALYPPPVFALLRAVVHAERGEAALARECFLRGEARAGELIVGDEFSWRRSDLVRWRERARRAVAR